MVIKLQIPAVCAHGQHIEIPVNIKQHFLKPHTLLVKSSSALTNDLNFKLKMRNGVKVQAKERLLQSLCPLGSVHRVNFHDGTSCLVKALNSAACHQLLSRLSELLTAQSVFYRSQMGRGAGIKCIKCPLLSFMNGLKDLQSSVIRPSIIVTPA